MKNLIIGILLILAGFSATARGGEYDSVLRQIEENSTTLAALRKQMEAEQLGSRTGIYLADPELEFNYLWGRPAVIGNRADIAVTQSFDFPTAYAHRGKIADLQHANAELAYKAERLNLLLSAKQICIDLIYHNALAKEYAVRLQNAARIAEAMQFRFDKGDANILEVNRAKLNLVTVQTEAANIEAERTSLLTELKAMNGGKDIDFAENVYPARALPANFEDWYAQAEAGSPALQYLNGQIEIERRQVKLNRALDLPKFSAGYMSERGDGERFHGMTFSVSIPLWENRNRVRQAAAQVQAAGFVLRDSKAQFYNRLQALYVKAAALQKNAQTARQALSAYGSEALLKKAFDAGEISLIEYLLEIEYYYTVIDKVLEAERDFELTAAELQAVEM